MPTRPAPTPEPGNERTYVIQQHLAYITGITSALFEPDASMTRADIAQALFNIAGQPGVTPRVIYSDVPIGHPNIAAITWAYENGLMEGFPDGSFRPSEGLTRGQLATLIVNWHGYTPVRTTTFPDALNHWANGFIGAVETRGHIRGYPDGTFRPDAQVSRAEVVTLLNSLIGRTAYPEHVRYLDNPFTDVSPSHWAFAQIMVAAVDHYTIHYYYPGQEVD